MADRPSAGQCGPQFRRRLALACGAAALLAALPAALRAQTLERDSIAVLALDFSGAEAFPDEVLRSAIVTSATRCSNPALAPLCLLGVGVERHYLDDRTLAADVVRLRVFYFTRGYRDAVIGVDTARVNGGVRLRFLVTEGEPVRVVSVGFEETTGLDAAVFRGLPLRPGEPFSMPAYESTRDSLTARLRGQGFAHAQVLPSYRILRDDAYQAEVVYAIAAGPAARFGEIDIVGANRISPSVVRRMLTFRTGDSYDQDALVRSQRNLFGLEVFRHAEVLALPGADDDSIVGVRVQVNEGDIHRVRLGVGVSTAEFLTAEGRWISRNFAGGARRLELRGRVSHLLAGGLQYAPFFETGRGIYGQVSGALTADFAQPWFFHPQNTLRTGLFVERRNLPDVYVRTSRGGYVSFARALSGGGSATFGYRPELTRLENEDGDLIFCVSLLACVEGDIQVLREPHWLAPLAVSVTRDRSNSFFAPTRGGSLRLDVELAGAATGSDFGYFRLIGEAIDYRTVGAGVILASRLRPGWARATADAGFGLHPQKRFFAGGANSVRGFGQYRLGPRLLTVDAARRLGVPVEQGGAGCTAQMINAGSCDAALLASSAPHLFDARPVGGAVLLEGNVEARFPLWAELRGAAFLDFGQVWRDHREMTPRGIIMTPGAGVRYHSPIGPIRVDVGYNPQGGERVSVLTTEVRACSAAGCEDIIDGRDYDPAELRNQRQLRPQPAVTWSPYRSFFDRVQLHFSIGQAF